MFPWGMLVSLAGQAVSGIASARNNKEQQRVADEEAARQQAYYAGKAAEDPLARSENQQLLGEYDRESRRQVETARNIGKITGATPEYSLGVQKAVAEGRANLMSNMSAGASARADRYNALGEAAQHQKVVEDQARRAARKQTYANLAANAAQAFGGIMDAYTTGAGRRNAPATVEEPSKIVTPQEQQKINSQLAQIGNQIKADNIAPAPGVHMPTEQDKINAQLAAINNQAKAANGFYRRPGIKYPR